MTRFRALLIVGILLECAVIAAAYAQRAENYPMKSPTLGRLIYACLDVKGRLVGSLVPCERGIDDWSVYDPR